MPAATAQPNIVYILDDDHRAELLGCAGHPMLRTPQLDRLAADGVRFAQACCTSPACTPSRTSHYTGQWERRHGINFNSGSSLAPAAWENSFPMRLKAAGYYLGWVGKNHVPAGQGGYGSGYFEEVFDFWYGNHGHSGFYPKEQAGGRRAIYDNAAADTQVEVFGEGAMAFLDGPQRPVEQPFCLCLTFNLPHCHGTQYMELRPTDDVIYRELYRDHFGDVPLPASYLAFQQIRQPRLPRDVYRGVYLPSYDYVREPHAMREHLIREYQAITGIDRLLGQLRAKLAALGVADNTIIVFSSDHGIHHGEHGLGGKCFLYEEDLRIPLIVYDPRLPAAARGQVRDELVAVPDMAPTMLELAGVPVPATMQGRSLLPLLRGDSPDWRSALFCEQLLDIQNYPRSEAVRTAQWKYIRYFARREDPAQHDFQFRGTLDDYAACLTSSLDGEVPVYEELYDLVNDPQERRNQAGDPALATTLRQQRELLLALAREAKGDPGPPLTLPLA